jgi:WD40 repeat protein
MAEKMILELSHGERDIKITAIAFKPGANAEEEGKRVWLGSNYGDIQEVDLETQKVTGLKPQAHGRREIVKIHRHQNSMWSLDEEGKLHVWLPDDHGLPNLQYNPVSHRVQKGHSFSLVVGGRLWHASGKELRIYRPGADGDDSFFVTKQPIVQSSAGEITSGATISSQLDRVYLAHTDGKVSIYSSSNFKCLGIVNVSVYKINTLAGAGVYLWAGYNTGMIYVYDTRTQPWTVKKEWLAHEGPVLNIITDRSSIWKLGYLHVASIGVDNSIKIWDGLLGDDWLGTRCMFNPSLRYY